MANFWVFLKLARPLRSIGQAAQRGHAIQMIKEQEHDHELEQLYPQPPSGRCRGSPAEHCPGALLGWPGLQRPAQPERTGLYCMNTRQAVPIPRGTA